MPKREEGQHRADVGIHDVHTILGPESAFEGKLMFDGTVRIDGSLKGEIRTDNTLVIGQSARVEARLYVGNVIINGNVLGDITATQGIEIHAPGRVRGNMTTPQLTIDKGVVFEGTCHMEEALDYQANPSPQLAGGTSVSSLLNSNKDPLT